LVGYLIHNNMKFKITLLIALTVLVSKIGVGQVSLTNAAASNTQNFDAIGTSATATLPTGFKIGTDWSTGLTATTLAYGNTGAGAVTGTSSGGAINWSNGITGSSTERAIGFLSTGSYTSPRSIMFAFTNNTGSTISSLDISWNYEKYRSGSRAFSWSFFHGNTSTAATAATSGNQSYAADLANTTIYNPAQSVSKSFTISGLSIANGTTYYLRWTYTGSAGSTNSQGLAIDDFSVTAALALPTYSLTYNGNGNTSGAVPVDATSPYVSGATITTLGNTGSLAKTGNTFAGWNTTANGSGTAQAASSTFSMPAANTVLYALWTTNNYTVTFDANTGSGSMTNQTIAYGAAANLTSNSFTKIGYSFAGWNTLANGTGTSYANAQSYTMGAANATLYAQWTANNNTLTFDGNGATSGSTADQTIATNASANLTSNGFIRTGYNFTGWSTTLGGSFTYADGASYTMGTSNTTLYAVWTVASLPTISYSGSLTSVHTTYGTASLSPATFAVSGSSLTDNITLTAPAGYEISSGSGYSTSLVLIQSGGVVSSTTINVRLAATTAVGTYAGTILLTSTGATSVNVSTVSSEVSQKALTISGLTGANKEYDGTIGAIFTGTASYVGLMNGETFSVAGTPSATFATAGVGTSKPITVSGYTAPTANYTITQPALSADITAKVLTVSGVSAANKPYDGTPTASITGGSLVGVISPDVVTLTQAGNFVSANVGTGISVTPNFSIGGTDAGNYTLTQPSGLSADITQGSQTITFGSLANQTVGAADYAPGATASSGLTVTYTSSNTAVATIVGGLIHVVGVGTTTITASQAGNGTYLAASDVNQNLTVVYPIIAAWDFFGENPTSPVNLNVTSTADVFNSNLDASNSITRGAGAAASAGANSFRTVGFKNEGISTANADYFQTTLSASAGYTLSLSSINARFAGTPSFVANPGVTSQFAYSLDGTNFILIGSPVQSTSLNMTVDLSGISALQSVSQTTTVTIRYYASGQTTTGGWGFNSPSSGSYGLSFRGSINEYISPLPVEFLEFTATCNEANATDLKWSTASEHNSDYFKIEKSTNGINWSMLAKVAAAGNATERMDYSFEDTEKTSGAYYKLWQYDVDGTANLLATVQENCLGSNPSLEPLVYPNPITDQELMIELRNNKVAFVTVQIYSMQGTLVYAQHVKATEQITLSKLNINPGIYQLILQPDAYEAKIVKICIK
jgi:uncharacterized repeat protein (TIGR02543 family)